MPTRVPAAQRDARGGSAATPPHGARSFIFVF